MSELGSQMKSIKMDYSVQGKSPPRALPAPPGRG